MLSKLLDNTSNQSHLRTSAQASFGYCLLDTPAAVGKYGEDVLQQVDGSQERRPTGAQDREGTADT